MRLRRWLRKRTVVISAFAERGTVVLRGFRARSWGGRTLIVDLFGRVEAQVDVRLGDAWFRLWGYGLSVKDVRGKQLLFSDRNAVGACVRVGPLLFRALGPQKGGRR